MTKTEVGVAGDPDSDLRLTVAELAHRHALELTRFAYLVCGDRTRAEDLVQDVFLALYRRFGDTLLVEKPLAYARRAIVNANVSLARKHSSSDVLTDRVPEGPHTDADPAERDAMWTRLQRLSQRQRAVLVLRFYLGYDDTEIADILDCRRGTVRSLASRALEELRALEGSRA